MKITIDETITANSYNIWAASGTCYLDVSCSACPFRLLAVKGCANFRNNLIKELNITSYPYIFDVAERYPELLI